MTRLRKNIIWLASYPKSGNTWFRVFLSNFLSDSEKPVNINDLHLSPIASSRSIIDRYLGNHSSDLTLDEINLLRPEIYRKISEENETDVFLKTHDAWEMNADGHPIFPEDVTNGVLYFVRNPLDIAVSFAFHGNSGFDRTISNMNDPAFGLCLNTSKLMNQIPQRLSSWSEHVDSWVHRSGLKVHVMRYEDMILDPGNTFSKALEFLQIDYTVSKLNLALKYSSFDILSEQEEQFGFHEKYINSEKFFRNGKVNNWKSYLDNDQFKTVIKHHKAVMKEFRYLE